MKSGQVITEQPISIRPVLAAILLTSASAIISISSIRAQEVSPITAHQKEAVIDSVTSSLIESYIFLDVAEEMRDHLRTRLREGAYDDLTTPFTFTSQLTTDLQSISHDLHLRVNIQQPRPIDPVGRPDPEEVARQQREQMRRVNFGFQKVEILDGNIGYLKLDGFIETIFGGSTAVAAMNFLAGADALIIDLRANGGGAPSMIQLISSYFFEEPQHLNSFYIRETDEWEQYWTQAHVEGPKMVDMPIFILTSGRTFSAAEECTYNLKNMERATIIGETTRGGAHPVKGRIFPFDGFAVSIRIPFGRAVNPITGTNWEGTGIEPHISVPAEEALERAIDEARRMLARTR
ncbi:S41 family peptidase [Candidatus Zixiibacteriota bacterium]